MVIVYRRPKLHQRLSAIIPVKATDYIQPGAWCYVVAHRASHKKPPGIYAECGYGRAAHRPDCPCAEPQVKRLAATTAARWLRRWPPYIPRLISMTTHFRLAYQEGKSWECGKVTRR